MSPLTPRPGHRLLRCPVCRLDLIGARDALVCRNRHSFDMAREGYVNLLSDRKRQPALSGDNREQLRHRAAFLDTGHFDIIAAAIVEHVQCSDAKPLRVLDTGSGTGHHLARIAESLPPPVVGLGLDISRAAARQAARRWPIEPELAVLTPQSVEFLALGCRQAAVTPAGVTLRLCQPVPDRLCRRFELARQLLRRAAGAHQPQITTWLDENCGADGWAMTPSGMRGVLNDAVSIYFANPTLDLRNGAPARDDSARDGLQRINPDESNLSLSRTKSDAGACIASVAGKFPRREDLLVLRTPIPAIFGRNEFVD